MVGYNRLYWLRYGYCIKRKAEKSTENVFKVNEVTVMKDYDSKKSTEELISELEWFKSELITGNKIIEYYQAQVDILTRAIKMLKSTLE